MVEQGNVVYFGCDEENELDEECREEEGVFTKVEIISSESNEDGLTGQDKEG